MVGINPEGEKAYRARINVITELEVTGRAKMWFVILRKS